MEENNHQISFKETLEELSQKLRTETERNIIEWETINMKVHPTRNYYEEMFGYFNNECCIICGKCGGCDC